MQDTASEFIACLESLRQMPLDAEVEVLAAKAQELRERLLAFGSQTESNVKAAENLDVGFFENEELNSMSIEVCTKTSGVPLNEIFYACEVMPIPEAIKEEYPDLTQDEWEAVFRLAVLTFGAFQAFGQMDTKP